MPFSDEVIPAAGLRSAEFVLRPITTADAELDYAAVIESRDFLRLWEQSTWPADGFTVEENRKDLADLEQWHAVNAAFTYTVLDPGGTECLGCVYIFPRDAKFLTRAQVTPVAGMTWSDVDDVLYHWVRKSRMESGMDGPLLAALRDWVRDDWGLERFVFVTNEQFVVQKRLFDDSDMSLQFEIREPGKPGTYLAYGCHR